MQAADLKSIRLEKEACMTFSRCEWAFEGEWGVSGEFSCGEKSNYLLQESRSRH